MTHQLHQTSAAFPPSVTGSGQTGSRPARMHCMDQPWRVYDDLLSAILKTPDILSRDGIVVMALEVGQTCREPQYAHMNWFPETTTMSRPETISALRGMTLVAQMLPPTAFRTEHHILGLGEKQDFSTPEAIMEQIHLIGQQVTAVVNLQHLTRQLTAFHRSWHQLRGEVFELPPPTMTIDEQGRLKTAAVLPLYGSWDFIGGKVPGASPLPEVLSGMGSGMGYDMERNAGNGGWGTENGIGSGATVIPMPGVNLAGTPAERGTPTTFCDSHPEPPRPRPLHPGYSR